MPTRTNNDDDDDDDNFLKVIFLDIDGVLLPFGGDDDMDNGGDGGDHDDNRADDDSKDKDKDNDNDKRLFPQRCIEPFRTILEHTCTGPGGGDTKLVLSSTWRMRPSFIQDITDCFLTYDLPIQEFYDTTSLTMHSLRQHEIADWIFRNTTDTDTDTNNDNSDNNDNDKKRKRNDNNKKDRRPRRPRQKICWIALDDEDLLEDAKYTNLFQNHFIKTDSKVGLTMDDAIKAIKLWNEQSKLS